MAIDLHIHIGRDADNRLNGTARPLDSPEACAFSGTLELLRVLEDLLAADPGPVRATAPTSADGGSGDR